MALKQVYLGKLGPFLYDDSTNITEVTGEHENALFTDGQLHVLQAPTDATHVVRKSDLDAAALMEEVKKIPVANLLSPIELNAIAGGAEKLVLAYVGDTATLYLWHGDSTTTVATPYVLAGPGGVGRWIAVAGRYVTSLEVQSSFYSAAIVGMSLGLASDATVGGSLNVSGAVTIFGAVTIHGAITGLPKHKHIIQLFNPNAVNAAITGDTMYIGGEDNCLNAERSQIIAPFAGTFHSMRISYNATSHSITSPTIAVRPMVDGVVSGSNFLSATLIDTTDFHEAAYVSTAFVGSLVAGGAFVVELGGGGACATKITGLSVMLVLEET